MYIIKNRRRKNRYSSLSISCLSPFRRRTFDRRRPGHRPHHREQPHGHALEARGEQNDVARALGGGEGEGVEGRGLAGGGGGDGLGRIHNANRLCDIDEDIPLWIERSKMVKILTKKTLLFLTTYLS